MTLIISSSKTEFAADEPILIDVTLKNNEAQKPARILDWVNPCNTENDSSTLPKEMSFFNIKTTGGQAAKYMGAVFKRANPENKDYKMLMPGDVVSCTINLGTYYEFAAGSGDDNYEIKYSLASMQLSDPDNNGNAVETLDSNSLTLKVSARDDSFHLRRRNLRGLQSGGTLFNGCTATRQSTINDARTKALSAATDAQSQINKVGNAGTVSYCPRYDEWFGSYSSTRHSDLKTGYDLITARLNDASIRFDCTCTS